MHFFHTQIDSVSRRCQWGWLAAREFFSFSLKIQIELDRRRKFFQSEIMSRDAEVISSFFLFGPQKREPLPRAIKKPKWRRSSGLKKKTRLGRDSIVSIALAFWNFQRDEITTQPKTTSKKFQALRSRVLRPRNHRDVCRLSP